MKNFYQKLLIFLTGGIFLTQACHADETTDPLLTATHRYIDFITELGSNDQFDPAIMTAICSPECKKIFNGRLIAESRDVFFADLLSIKQAHGGWRIQPVEIITSPKSMTAVFRLIIDIGHNPTSTTIVILRFNPDYTVKEINEVLNQFEGDAAIDSFSELPLLG